MCVGEGRPNVTQTKGSTEGTCRSNERERESVCVCVCVGVCVGGWVCLCVGACVDGCVCCNCQDEDGEMRSFNEPSRGCGKAMV